MRILRKKNITNQTPVDAALQPAQVELEPVVDHETANAIASKEANEEAAEKNIEASGIQKVADEVVKSIQDPKKDTPAPKTPSLKPYTEAKQVVDRKALGALIKECKEAGRKYRVKKSLEEGFRYVFEEFEDAYPECYFVCHSDEDANNENGYFDTVEDAKAYAEAHPEICCIFKVCGNEEEKVWEKSLEECNKQEVKEDVEEVVVAEETLPETFDGKMDFLAADEDEAIAGYEKILPLIEEESVKEQLTKILEEEKAHKAFLEGVKADHSLVYSHEESKEEDPELVAQEAEVAVIEESKEEEHKVCPDCGKEICECNKQKVEEDAQLKAVSDMADQKQTDEPLNEALLVRYYRDDLPFDKQGKIWISKVGETKGIVVDTATNKPVLFDLSQLADARKFMQDNKLKEKGFSLTAKESDRAKLKAQGASDGSKAVDYSDELLDEAIVSPVSEPEDKEAVPAVDIAGEIKVEGEPEVVPEEDTAVVEITPELDPEAEIDIDSIETFEPTDEIGKKTMTTIKDAGDGAMFAFKDTLKDLYNLKIKVSDLQQLLSSSSDWLLDLLGFNHDSEMEIHPEELPEEPTPVEEPEIVGGEFDEVKPVTDLSTIDINDFDEVDPVDYEEEDEKLFVED
jgi:rubrerythrin